MTALAAPQDLTRPFDQERDCPVEERSHFESGYNARRREDVPKKVWDAMRYRRLVGQWEPRR